MFGVTVAELGAVMPLAVVINGSGTEEHLILAIAVGIANGQTVCALPAICRIARIARKRPAQRQCSITPVPGRDVGARVVAPAVNRARADTIAERNAGEE